MKINVIKKQERSNIKYPEYGDIVCWAENCGINEKYQDKPCLITYDCVCLLENPRTTWCFDCFGGGSLLDEIYRLLNSGKLRYMNEVEKIEIINERRVNYGFAK